MRHRVYGKTFGRRPDQRKALFRGLATSLLEMERIETTLPRAKELRSWVEPLITLGKRGDLHARRQAASVLYKKDLVSKLFGEVAERFKTRPGGYTRILRTGFRRGDGAAMALIELIPSDKAKKEAVKKDGLKKTSKKVAPKQGEKAETHAKKPPMTARPAMTVKEASRVPEKKTVAKKSSKKS